MFSVDLGNGRVLWLFGDSFLATKRGDTRQQAVFVRNTVAIETGYDPSHATIKFYAGQRGGHAGDFAVSDKPGLWLWPLHGMMLGRRLLLFYVRLVANPAKDSLGFRPVGWTAFFVENPEATPDRWIFRQASRFHTPDELLVGVSLLRMSDYVYAFVLDDRTKDAYLLRWPVSEASGGHLSEPRWWCGSSRGWLPSIGMRQVVIHQAGPDFSVQRAPRGDFIEVNSNGFGATAIVWRHARNAEGPWGAQQVLYNPGESKLPDALVYAAKSHPELAGSDLVVTYFASVMLRRFGSSVTAFFMHFVKVSDLATGAANSRNGGRR